MNLTEKYALIRGLFEIAWIDGEIQDEERNILRILVSNLELGEENDKEVQSWFDQPPEGDDTWAALAHEETAELAMQRVLMVAAADLTMQWEELQLLDDVREKLGVSQKRFDEIALEVERSLAGN